MSRRSRRLATLVIAVWAAIQAIALARGLSPLPRPWSGPLPWRMFSDPMDHEPTIVAEGVTPAGATVEIPLRELFRFTRGWTGLREYDSSAILRDPGHAAERQAFARWLALKMAERGVPLRSVRVSRRSRDLKTGVVRARELVRVEVEDG